MKTKPKQALRFFATVLICAILISTITQTILVSASDLATNIQLATDQVNVIEIDNAIDFARIGRDSGFPLNGHYVLTDNINLSELATLPVNQVPTTGSGTAATNNRAWHATRGWLGIGSTNALPLPNTERNVFTGTLDGNGHTISGLWMNRTSAAAQMGTSQGIFRILRGATVRNLTIELDSRGITGKGERRGVLAGNAFNDTVIDNVHVIGNGAPVIGSANYIAGLVGELRNSTINNASVDGVQVEGFSYTGGLVGVTHNWKKTAKKGLMLSRIDNSVVRNVTVAGRGSYAGGIGGAIYDATTVTNVHVDGGTIRTRLSYAGGFGGVIGYGSHVHDSSVNNATVTATLEYAGGFVGALYGLVREGRRAQICGGSVGAHGNLVEIFARNFAGGFAGIIYDHSNVTLSRAYASVHVRDAYVGGFTGRLDRGVISNAYAHGELTVTGKLRQKAYLGGVGGFVGNIAANNHFTTTHAIHSSYANVSFNLPRNYSMTRVGGFVGNRHTSKRFTTGNTYSFFNTDTAGMTYASGPANRGAELNRSGLIPGVTSAEMSQQATFIGWDFNSIWTMASPHGYPVFRSDATCTVPPTEPPRLIGSITVRDYINDDDGYEARSNEAGNKEMTLYEFMEELMETFDWNIDLMLYSLSDIQALDGNGVPTTAYIQNVQTITIPPSVGDTLTIIFNLIEYDEVPQVTFTITIVD